MGSKQRFRIGKEVNSMLDDFIIVRENFKQVLRGNNLVQKALSFMVDDTRYKYPDSRPYLEKLGIEVVDGDRNDPTYECTLPDHLNVRKEENVTENGSLKLTIYDERGIDVVNQVVSNLSPYHTHYSLAVDTR